MIASATMAIAAPFHLFLFAYAVLGPLHYLTEISWLHDRHYFVQRASLRRLWLVVVAGAAVATGFGFVSSDLLGRPVAPTLEIGLVYLALVTGAVAVFVRHTINAVALAFVGALAIALAAGRPWYAIVAYLLITIVHVLVFTACFVLFGAIRSKSASGLISVGVLILCATAPFFLRVPAFETSATIRTMYAGFEPLNRILLDGLGARGGGVHDRAAAPVMSLIAFAYTYHYLNWFSKTSIIGWHEIPRRRAVAILVAWIAGVGVYLYDYRAGFALFYLLSIAHVMLEFPLNHQTITGIVRSIAPRQRTT